MAASSETQIAVAGAGDLSSLAGIILAFRDHLGARGPSPEALGEYLPRVLADDRCEFLLARQEGDTVGYANYRFFPSIWSTALEVHLEDLFVLEPQRSKRIGQKLLEAVLTRGQERGATAIGLHTNEGNESAQAFYRRHGFVPQTEARWEGGREIYWARSIP